MVLEEVEGFGIPLGIPDEFPYEFGPDSPEESVLGSSTETESDEDELTHLLTRSTLRETPHYPASYFKTESVRVMASSPKSTLSRPKTWPSQVPTEAAKEAPFCKDQDGWDAFLTATAASAGEEARVEMMRGLPEANYCRSKGLLYPHNAYQVHLLPRKTSCSGFYPQHGQMVNHQMKQCTRWICENGQMRGRYVRPIGILPQPASPNPPAEHNNISSRGMRAVFLSGAKTERTGTGVFLPRRYDENKNNNNRAANPPKKQSCSPVLIPAKVIQSLNLNFEEIGVPSQAQPCYNYNVGFAPNYDALMARRNAILAQKKRNLRVEGVKYEIDLPQDWTY